jgi:hypothetical protein
MLLNELDTFIEFHFIKNGNQDSMKKMPIYDLKVWTHDSNTIVIMLKDPWKMQLVGLIYSINWINNELVPTLVEKGFLVKNMKEKTLHDDVAKWNEFVKLLKIE